MNALQLELLRRARLTQVFAWLGLVPMLGLPFALAGIVIGWRCRTLGRSIPNPVRRDVLIASWMSLTGLLMSLLLLTLLIMRMVSRL